MDFMRLKSILIQKKLDLPLSKDYLEQQLKNYTESYFRVETSDEEFRLISNFSSGTMIVKGNPGMIEGIKIFCKFEEPLNSTLTRIILFTKLRIELKCFGIIWFISILFQFLSKAEMPFWINSLLFPITIIWFWIVYRIQEIKLLKKVENYFNTL